MNLIAAVAENGQAKIGNYHVPVDEAAAKRMKGDIVVGVRPESWRQVSGQEDGGLPVSITVVEELGSDAYVYGTSGVEGTPNNVIVRVNGRDTVHKGQTIYVTTDPHSVHVFDADTGERLSE
jgi:multiple sugar transport system ATP-binding protein